MPKQPARAIIAALTSTPMAILEDQLRLMLQIAARENLDIAAVEAQLGRKLDNTHTVSERNGVAIIPVVGPIFRYANLFSQISGGASVQLFARDFHAALNNPDVRAIILNIDSPGGEANGISEAADMVYAARGKKPITAYVGGYAASAAYWIASACDEIVCNDSAVLGSIGTIAAIPDPALEHAGEVIFVSSQSPRKHADPMTDQGASDIQAILDALTDVFVQRVARHRGVSVDTVLADFGQGGVFVGSAAVAAGLADRIGAFEATLAAMAGQTQPALHRASAAQTQTIAVSAHAGGGMPAPRVSLSAPRAQESAPIHTTHVNKEHTTMAEDPQEGAHEPPVLPPIQPPQFSVSDPAVAAQVNAVVAQMTAQFEDQRRIVLEQAQAQFQRQLAEMQAQQAIQTYAQHITTPTMQRPHALPFSSAEVVTVLSSLSPAQRTSVQGLFDRILDSGLVSFEEIGSAGEGDGAPDVSAEWTSAVQAKVGMGMARSAAIEAVRREKPDLYAAYNASGATVSRKGGR